MDDKQLLTKAKVYAVVGASDDPNKYGYRVYKFLKDRGFNVFPVNPNRNTVQGDKAFADLASLPIKPDIVDVVTQPEVSEKIYAESSALGIETFWLQPGAEASSLISKPGVVAGKCIMVEMTKLGF